MEFWQMIEEVAMGILSTVGVIIAIVLRSAKPKSPGKQAIYEEEVKHKAIEQKQKRLCKLREEDLQYHEKLSNNLKEEAILEKELGNNA